MLESLKTISKDTLIYGVGNGVSGVISFLLLPLYARYLTPEDYGFLSIFVAFQACIEILVSFGLSSGLFRYFLMSDVSEEQELVVNTCFFTQLLFIFLTSILFLNPISLHVLSVFFFKTSQYKTHFFISILTAILSAFSIFFFAFTRAKRKPTFFASMQILKAGLLCLVNYSFVVFIKMNFYGVLLGNLIVFAFVDLIISFWFAKYIKRIFSIRLFKKILKFVFPIMLANMLFFLLSFSDRFFINQFLSTKDVGLYSFGSKIASIVQVGLITPFSTALAPYALSIAKSPDFERTFSKIIKYFTILVFFVSSLLGLFSKEFLQIFATPQFLNCHGLVGPLLLANLFFSLYYNLSVVLDIKERTHLGFFIVLTGSVVGLAINYLTIPIFGTYGAALAVCLSNAILAILMYTICQRQIKIPFELFVFFKLLFIYAFVLVFPNIASYYYDFQLYHKIFLYLIAIVLAWSFKIFDQSEILAFKKAIRRVLSG